MTEDDRFWGQTCGSQESDKVFFVHAGKARIPALGCGTWELRESVCAEIVAEAIRIGYLHIDTAQGYGNEAAVGEGIRVSGVGRDSVFVTTKVMPQLASEAALQRSVEDSLARLDLERVDLLLIHWPNPAISLRESMRALADAKRRGLTQHIGVSNFTVAALNEAVRLSPEPLVTNQVEYHPYLDQAKVLAANRRHGLATTAYCPIARGHVVNDPVLSTIGVAHGKSAVQVTLRWLIQQGDVISIPRTSRVERLKENFGVFDFQLTGTEMDQVERLARTGNHLVNAPEWVPEWD
jgi:diketogulonate reductase-like aldo/keto reductase